MRTRFIAIFLFFSMMAMIPSCTTNNAGSNAEKEQMFDLIKTNGQWHGSIKNDLVDKEIVYISATNQQTNKVYYNRIDTNTGAVTQLEVHHLFDADYTLFELFPLEDGGFYIFARTPTVDKQILKRFDANFDPMYEINLLNYIELTYHEIFNVETYSYNICGTTSDGDVVVETQKEVFTIAPDGERKQSWVYENPSGYTTHHIEALVSGNDIYRLEYDIPSDKISISTLNSDGSIVPFAEVGSVYFTVMLDKGVFYVADDSEQKLYRLNDESEMVFLLDYSVVRSSRNFHEITSLQDGRYIAWISIDYYIISTSNEEEQCGIEDERVTITLATFGSGQLIRESIYNFNQKNNEYTIEIVDYSEIESGLAKLNVEIIAGTAPDILYWGFGLTGNINPEVYSSAGVLLDLYPYINSDEDIGMGAILPNLLEALQFAGDELYEMPLSVFLMFVAGSIEVVGSEPGWTFDEYFALLRRYPDATLPFGSAHWSSILSSALSNNYRTFVDWEKGEAHFDCEEFSRLLEMAKDYWNHIDAQVIEAVSIQEGKQLLTTNILSNVSSIQRFPALFGTEVNYIGFPTERGVGNSFILNGSISINAASDYPDVCWEFLKSMLSYEMQLNRNAGFPVTVDALNHRLDNAPQFEEAAGFLYSDNEGNSWSVRLEDASLEDIALVRSLITSCDRIFRINNDIMAIIEEVAPSYFSGDRTLEDTIEIIQSRAQVYVSERSW